MIRYVACTPCSAPSGRLLARKITELQGKKCYFTTSAPPQRLTHRRCVRWGNKNPFVNPSVNELDSLASLGSKHDQLARMAACAVQVPDYGLITPEYCTWVAPRNRIFRKLSHHAGNDNPYIVMKDYHISRTEIGGYDYWMDYIRKIGEFRIHVFNGEVIRVQKKRRVNSGVSNDRIRTSVNGWVSVEVDNSYMAGWPADIHLQAGAAVRALGLVFGAVDVLVDKNNKVWVLEVNTAPGLNDGGATKYAEQLLAHNWSS